MSNWFCSGGHQWRYTFYLLPHTSLLTKPNNSFYWYSVFAKTCQQQKIIHNWLSSNLLISIYASICETSLSHIHSTHNINHKHPHTNKNSHPPLDHTHNPPYPQPHLTRTQISSHPIHIPSAPPRHKTEQETYIITSCNHHLFYTEDVIWDKL